MVEKSATAKYANAQVTTLNQSLVYCSVIMTVLAIMANTMASRRCWETYTGCVCLNEWYMYIQVARSYLQLSARYLQKVQWRSYNAPNSIVDPAGELTALPRAPYLELRRPTFNIGHGRGKRKKGKKGAEVPFTKGPWGSWFWEWYWYFAVQTAHLCSETKWYSHPLSAFFGAVLYPKLYIKNCKQFI